MKKTAYVYANYNSYSKEFNYSVLGYETSSKDYILVKEFEVEFETLNDKILKVQLAKQLQEKIREVQARAYLDQQEIETQIAELTSLEDLSDRDADE